MLPATLQLHCRCHDRVWHGLTVQYKFFFCCFVLYCIVSNCKIRGFPLIKRTLVENLITPPALRVTRTCQTGQIAVSNYCHSSNQPITGRYVIVLFVAVTDTAGLLWSLFDGGLVTYVTSSAIGIAIVAILVIICLLCCYRRLKRRMTGCSAALISHALLKMNSVSSLTNAMNG